MPNENQRKLDPTGEPILSFINTICDEVGPRISGSEEERKAGEIIYTEMATFCDSVKKEDFSCRPGGFLDFIKITALFYYLGIVAYFFFPLLTSILLFVGLAIYFLQQILLYEAVDFLFPEISTFHVVGKINPNKPPKNLVLLSGHHDSAFEFPLFGKLGEKSVYVIIFTVVIVVLNIVIALLRTLFADQNLISILDTAHLLFSLLGIIFVTIITLFLRSDNVVMGANDNLTAVGAVMECGRYLAKHRPEETEVWLVSFAGEEHMRGSKRFVAQHQKELRSRNGMLFNLETLSADDLLLATREPMFLAKHSSKVIDLISSAANQVGVPIRVGPLPFAGSDAANFSRKGLHAATLFGLAKEGLPPYWHTLEDTADKLSGPKIAKAAEIVIQFVLNVDQS